MMSLTSKDYMYLQKMMNESPHNQEVLQNLLDSQQYTISKISHEIRNPLSLVYSTFQLIEAQHPETKSFQHWDQLRGDLEYMIQLLQELSTLNNGEKLHKTEFSSYDFLSKICLSFASSCIDSDIIFSSKIPKNLPLIFADRIQLQEVILNLLKNAKEAISGQGFITLESFSEDNQLILHISDTGCGIPQEHLATLFDPFITYKTEGTGLGLAIAKRTLLAHGGHITVHSKVGRGTRFIITIPII